MIIIVQYFVYVYNVDGVSQCITPGVHGSALVLLA